VCLNASGMASRKSIKNHPRENNKNQTPSSRKASSRKTQIVIRIQRAHHWSLLFGASLVFGVWILVFPAFLLWVVY
jgi:hypothetical protein